MISDEELNKYEREVEDMAGLGEPVSSDETEESEGDPERIDRIVERALYQVVVKDTASFVFNSFGSALFGLAGAVMGHAASPPERNIKPAPSTQRRGDAENEHPPSRG